MTTQPSHRIRVWRYRDWCCRCLGGALWPCSGGSGYATPSEAADAGRRHLREVHGAV